jgi:hypothetical protein
MSRKYFLIATAALIVVVGLLVGCAADPDKGIYPATGQVTVTGLPPVFRAGKWVLPWDQDPEMFGLVMIISEEGKVIIKQGRDPIPFKIKDGQIWLGGPLDGVKIAQIADPFTGDVAICPVTIDGTADMPAGTLLGQFCRNCSERVK